MTNDSCTPILTTARPARETQPVSNPVFISVAEVRFGTAAATAPGIPRFGAVSRLRAALRDRRTGARRHPPRRAVYFENAAMRREMHSL